MSDQPEHIPESTTPEPTLADTDDPQSDRGRIGYGRNERTSSWLLGTALIVLVLAVGAYQWFGPGNKDSEKPSSALSLNAPVVGKDAPLFTLPTFDGEEISLADQHGKVVIVNFWGSWCEPCKREMPAFQAYWESAPDDVMIIGVGSKQDSEEQAREFAERYSVTYPIGQDIAGDKVTSGTISQDYQITFYPMTFIVDANGKISSLIVGEMNESDLDTYVRKARDGAATSTPHRIAMLPVRQG